MLNEIPCAEISLTFEELLASVLREIEQRIRNGQLTERGLARKTGLSQPHVHHILKKKRGITAQVADRFLEVLGMEASELVDQKRHGSRKDVVSPDTGAGLLLPLYEGAAGPGLSVPRYSESGLRFPFPGSLLPSDSEMGGGTPRHAVLRVGEDVLLTGLVAENDLLVVSLASGRARSAERDWASGRVTLWELDGSWILDIHNALPHSASEAGVAGLEAFREESAAEGLPRDPQDLRKLIERRERIRTRGQPVALVHWLVRRMYTHWIRGE